jgi:hypothetical protein
MAISGHQWPSVAISGHQWQSMAINGNQWQSVTTASGYQRVVNSAISELIQ